jgi:hypothetical protein
MADKAPSFIAPDWGGGWRDLFSAEFLANA